MDPELKIIFGFISWGILAVLGFSKKLRDDQLLGFLLLLTGLLAIYPLGKFFEDAENQRAIHENSYLLLPFTYLASYGLLRAVYKKMHGREPTYNRASRYDNEEGRYQNWMDYTVFIGPIAISMFLIMILATL